MSKNMMTDFETKEPFLDPKNARPMLYPIFKEDLWKMYMVHRAAFWVPEELDFSKDLNDWNNVLNDGERKYIKMVLAFFAGSDFIVNENCEKDEEENVPIFEYQFFNRFKMMMEDIHSITYANLIQAYVRTEEERQQLFKAVETIPVIKQKADWCRKYISNGDFVTRLVAFSVVEGVFFSGSFCAIFYMRKRCLLPGLCSANDLIAKDEGYHRDFAALVYRKYIKNKLSETNLINIIKEAVEIEKEFCCEALSVSLIGMNADLMGQYIEYVSDHLSIELIGRPIYNTQNPFDWMITMGLGTKDDFFSNRSTNYANQNVLATNDKSYGNSNLNQIAYDSAF